jgi:three-Cys-motif partner protein
MPDSDAHPYSGREQTEAKHFILRRYLERLAFKILTVSELTYVDGFSGPWETKTESFSDSSFMIAIDVLMSARKTMLEQRGKCPRIRCFFSELNAEAFSQLQSAVAPFHRPEEGFEICTYHGEFEGAVADIQTCIGTSFALIFIDPTGWTGYAYEKIKPLLIRRKCEALITFMYAFVYRFIHSEDEDTVNSLNPILGGLGWRDRLDSSLPRGEAVERLFRETLKAAGNFRFVISTKIEKPTTDCPHFYITYGTKSPDGLKTFRETEYAALRAQAKSRANAKEKKRERRFRTTEMFAGHDAQVQEATIDDVVEEQKLVASGRVLEALSKQGSIQFDALAVRLLEEFVLRETDVKNICVDLVRSGKIENTWGLGNRKPQDTTIIKLKG